MPHYDYECPKCQTRATLRRLISELDEPIESLCCGQPMRRLFSPNGQIFIPNHFHYTYSDFHDVTEKELAKDPYVERSSRVFSSPGHGRG